MLNLNPNDVLQLILCFLLGNLGLWAWSSCLYSNLQEWLRLTKYYYIVL